MATAFLSKLIFFHTIIEWFKNVMPIQLLFLTQFFLNNYYLLRIVNGHHVEFFFGIIFFFRFTWSVWMNCFAKQKHTVSKSVIIGKPANLLIECEYIDWMRHLLIMNALFCLSGKLILFFSLKPRWTLELGQLRWNNFSFKHLWTIFNPYIYFQFIRRTSIFT